MPDFSPSKIKFFFTVVLLLALCFVFRNFLVKQMIALGASVTIGAPVTIAKLNIDLIRQEVDIEGLNVYNPADFAVEPFIELNKARIEYNPWRLLTGEVHFDLLYVDIRSVTYLVNEDRGSNISSLALVKRIAADKKKKNKFNLFRFKADVLRLNIEQLVQVTRQENKEPYIKVYEYPARNKVFRNITSPEQMVVLVLLQGLGKATIQSVALHAAGVYFGVNTLPVSVAGIMLKKDNTAGEWPINSQQARQACLDVIERTGQLLTDKKEEGILEATIYGAHITIRITDAGENATRIRVYARKMFLPRRELAAGVLYQIAERIEERGSP